jgi:hypothetical protein
MHNSNARKARNFILRGWGILSHYGGKIKLEALD